MAPRVGGWVGLSCLLHRAASQIRERTSSQRVLISSLSSSWGPSLSSGGQRFKAKMRRWWDTATENQASVVGTPPSKPLSLLAPPRLSALLCEMRIEECETLSQNWGNFQMIPLKAPPARLLHTCAWVFNLVSLHFRKRVPPRCPAF